MGLAICHRRPKVQAGDRINDADATQRADDRRHAGVHRQDAPKCLLGRLVEGMALSAVRVNIHQPRDDDTARDIDDSGFGAELRQRGQASAMRPADGPARSTTSAWPSAMRSGSTRRPFVVGGRHWALAFAV